MKIKIPAAGRTLKFHLYKAQRAGIRRISQRISLYKAFGESTGELWANTMTIPEDLHSIWTGLELDQIWWSFVIMSSANLICGEFTALSFQREFH